MQSLEIRLVGKKFKIGVWVGSKLIEELGSFSADNFGNLHLRVDFFRLDYYLAGGVFIPPPSIKHPFYASFSQLFKLRSALIS